MSYSSWSVSGEVREAALLRGEAEKLVDVTAGADNLYVLTAEGYAVYLRLHLKDILTFHLLLQQTYRPDVERMAVDALTVADEAELRGAAANIDVEVAALGRDIGQVVVVDNLRLLRAGDDIEFDVGLVLYLVYDGLTVLCVAHCRRGAGAVAVDAVDLHKLAVGFHRGDELPFTLLGDTSVGEDIHTQPQGDAEEQQLSGLGLSVVVDIDMLYQQPGGIGADIDGCKVETVYIHCLMIISRCRRGYRMR